MKNKLNLTLILMCLSWYDLGVSEASFSQWDAIQIQLPFPFVTWGLVSERLICCCRHKTQATSCHRDVSRHPPTRLRWERLLESYLAWKPRSVGCTGKHSAGAARYRNNANIFTTGTQCWTESIGSLAKIPLIYFLPPFGAELTERWVMTDRFNTN